MVMNKKGQTLLVGMMVFIFVLMAALILITPLKEIIAEQRDATHLDCGNATISFGQKATCLVADLTLPYFIGVVVAAGAGFVAWKLFREG